MNCINFKKSPIKVYGVPFFEKTKIIRRIPPEVTQKVKSLESLGRRCPGARICFKTDASEFTLRITLETLGPDVGMSIFSCQAAAVLIGDRQNFHFAGLVYPPDYKTLTFEKSIKKGNCMENVTIFLPRNEVISDIDVIVDDNATVKEPDPYIDIKPVLFYGSSITEGGCCSNIFNAYNAILSNRLNVDYYNFGFSGSARGEMEIADYINTIDMGVFVYDYDHNAPSEEHLEKTHEPFFKRIREKNPDLPVIMMSKPAAVYSDADKVRREIIKKTYDNAVKNGDKNVYFIDGETFYGNSDRENCSVDACHPNDIGMIRMANVIEPVLKGILERR